MLRKLIPVFVVSFMVSCSFEYNEGETLYANHRYDEARIHFVKVERSSSYYLKAIKRISQIDSIHRAIQVQNILKESREAFENGKWYIESGQYTKGQTYLLRVVPSSEFFKEAQTLLRQISYKVKDEKTAANEKQNANYEKQREQLAKDIKTQKLKEREKELNQSPTPAPSSNTKIRDWKRATEARKLKMCVAMAIVTNKDQGVRITAMDLYNCIEIATKGITTVDNEEIGVIASACIVIMRQ